MPQYEVEQAKIADLDEQGQDRRRHGEQQSQHHVAQKEPVAEEPQMGEGEGGHRRDRERQKDGEGRDQQRIAEHLPVAQACQNVPVIAPHPDARQRERMRLQFAELLEAVERREADRQEHRDRQHDERSEGDDRGQAAHPAAGGAMIVNGVSHRA